MPGLMYCTLAHIRGVEDRQTRYENVKQGDYSLFFRDLEKGGNLVRRHFLPKVTQSIIFIAFNVSSEGVDGEH